jgi:polyketide biosynthesis acyl carrier protein
VERDEIFAILQQNTGTVLAIDPQSVPPRGRLADLGANSIDRTEIVTMTIEALGIRASLVELAQVNSIEGLVSFLHEKSRAR